jgi:hypothetical protein
LIQYICPLIFFYDLFYILSLFYSISSEVNVTISMKQTNRCSIQKAAKNIIRFSVDQKYVLFTVGVSQIEIKSSLGHQGKWTQPLHKSVVHFNLYYGELLMFICCCLFHWTWILIGYVYAIVFCCMSSTHLAQIQRKQLA